LSIAAPLASAQQGDFLRIAVQASIDLDPETNELTTVADESAIPLWAVITQTCDIRRVGDVRRFLDVAHAIAARTKEQGDFGEDGRNAVRHFAFIAARGCFKPLLDNRLI